MAETAAAPAQDVALDFGPVSSQIREYVAGSDGRIQVQVSSLADGLQIIKNVCIVRVRGNASRLLIMEDYMPIIGEILGGVDIIGKDFYKTLEPVNGYFCHDHNVFFLLLRDDAQRVISAKVSEKLDVEIDEERNVESLNERAATRAAHAATEQVGSGNVA
jgi:hypothetical protein